MRAANAEEEAARREIEALIQTRDRDEWYERLTKANVCVGKVYDVEEMVAGPPVLHRRMVVDIQHPTLGSVRCGSGSWGGRWPSLAPYVTGMEPTDGASAAARMLVLAIPRSAVHNHFLLSTDANGSQTLVGTGACGPDVLEDFEACDRGVAAFRKLPDFGCT